MTEAIQLVTGREAEACLPAVAGLRLAVFREYPYLYAGKQESEDQYLAGYAAAADGCVLTVSAGGRVVGAATGMPLSLEQQELLTPFAATPYAVGEIYYVGELLFYPDYRNRGLGMQTLQILADKVRSFGRYRYLACATVMRPPGHPLQPADYLPIDRFLARTGFKALPGVFANFTWCETDSVSREHQMQFWLKEL